MTRRVLVPYLDWTVWYGWNPMGGCHTHIHSRYSSGKTEFRFLARFVLVREKAWENARHEGLETGNTGAEDADVDLDC